MKLKSIKLIAGICLLIVTVIEVFENGKSFTLELEHGLLIFAMAHVLSSAIEVMEGVSKIHEHRAARIQKRAWRGE